MSFVRRFTVVPVTNSGGDATAFTAEAVNGRVVGVIYVKDGSAPYDAGVDFAITSELTGQGVWTETDVDADKTVSPRQPTHDAVGVASLYAVAGEPVEGPIYVSDERIEIVISNGGDTKTGTFEVLVA